MLVITNVVDHGGRHIQVIKSTQELDKTNGVYSVFVDGIGCHRECSAEDVIRALGSYLNKE